MVNVMGKCSSCGVPLDVKMSAAFEEAKIVAALCAGCTDQTFLNGGGAILRMREEPEGALFPLGKVTITAGAIEALSCAGEHAANFVGRHVRGDWGEYGRFNQIELTGHERRLGWEATDNSGKINKSNVLNRRDRIMSEYLTARGKRLWVISDWGRGTTVLLPEEY